MKYSKTINCLLGISIFLWLILTFYGQDIKQWRIQQHKKQSQQSYNNKFEKYKIICHQCKGSGEYPTDVNKLMMDASLALFVNHHLMVDKCKECVKLPYGETHDYCDTVQGRYQILLKEYAAAGPKIEMASCSECMGMGSFTIQNPDGTYVTQKEYDEEHKNQKTKDH